jgi:hypothetical protein
MDKAFSKPRKIMRSSAGIHDSALLRQAEKPHVDRLAEGSVRPHSQCGTALLQMGD